nr:reverse transcriptase domain-containing protein [Tanacetum cinerariifolium]
MRLAENENWIVNVANIFNFQEHRAEGGISKKGSDLGMLAAGSKVLSQGASIPSHQKKEVQKEKRCSKGWKMVYSIGSETKKRVCPHTREIQGIDHPTVDAGILKVTTRALAPKEHSSLMRNIKKCIKDPIEIYNIKQRDGESTEDFVRRGEVAASNHERKKSFSSWKQQEARQKQNFKKGSVRNQQRMERKQDRFTLLTKTPKEILALDKGKFKPLSPMTTLIRPKVKNQMIPSITPLFGVQWRDNMVVGANIVAGRPGVRKIQAVPSTAHEMLKFPVTGGTVTLQSSRIIPLECTMVSGPKVPQRVIDQVREEKIQVAIHPEYPKQTIMIGSTLTKKGRKELCGLLRSNLDIFAWRPADMTGVPRHIAEHRLNICEGCLPVRQKKRGQSPERNKAVCEEEEEKLVDADIIKEVHYDSWLSNPVMVKKHDGSWRMCVDFKDLNKACLKDGYSLPEIDWKIGRNLEVYVDDLVIKIRTEKEVIRDIEETFKTLKEINMKLTPKKCAFGMREGAFLGYKVDADGLRVCPDKVEAVLNLPSPKCLKKKEELIMYLAAVAEAISTVLMTKRNEKQMPIYFVSRALQGPGVNYTPIEKLILALDDTSYTPMEDVEELSNPWILFMDRSSCIDGFGAGLIITNPKGMKFTYALRFKFNATNNEAEYEALIAGLWIAEKIGIQNLQANVDSKLVANQRILHKKVPRWENKKSKIASTSFAHLSKQILMEEHKEKSIDEKEVLAVVEEEGHTWMTPVYEYLTEGIILEEKKKARAIHRKAGGMHFGPRSVVAKALRSGYYWPTMHTDARNLIKECSGCQGIDITGPFLEGPEKVKFLIVAMDYFTKWIEAKPMATITGAQVKKFVWDNIVCRFGVPGEIVSENEKQFRDNPFKDRCEKLSIRQCLASVKHSQANGIVERANRSLGEGIKARNEETPFSLTYEAEAVIPVEIGMPTLRTAKVDMIKNNEALEINLDLLEEKREQEAIQEARSKAKIERYYNVRVRSTSFRPRDLVYLNNEASHVEDGGKLGPKWEGPYEVTEALGKGAYKLRDRNGNTFPRTWNVYSRKKCYVHEM